jgi:hypothetical protein
MSSFTAVKTRDWMLIRYFRVPGINKDDPTQYETRRIGDTRIMIFPMRVHRGVSGRRCGSSPVCSTSGTRRPSDGRGHHSCSGLEKAVSISYCEDLFVMRISWKCQVDNEERKNETE